MATSEALKAIDSYGRSLRSSKTGRAYRVSPEKREFDRYASGVLRQLARPIIIATCWAVRTQDGGPGIIKLPRVGFDGQIFGERKIRSMYPGAELLPTPAGPKNKDDPRVTVLGKFIRAKSIDELPQLDNVYEGTMSMVGPRPMQRCEFDAYRQVDPGLGDSYTAGRPGLSGLEQVYGRGALSLEERIGFVREYADIACMSLDRHILALTPLAVFSGKGAF